MINTKCPVCFSSVDLVQERSLFEIGDEYGHTYSIVKCDHCNNIFTWFDKDINIDLYYDDLDYTLQDTRNTIFHTIQKLEYNRVLRQLKKRVAPGKNTLLDFGCGKGVFLALAKEKGFSVKGVETSLPRAGFAEKHYHIEVNKTHYESGSIFNQKFAVITLSHVVEHLIDPKNLLRNLIKDNLEDNGILVIEAPNFSSWQSTWAGKRWMQLDAPRHMLHFTPVTFTDLVVSAKCRIIHRQFFSFHLGIMGMAQTMMDWIGYKGFLMSDLKHKRSAILLLKLTLVLPFATVAELAASLAGKGGVLRYYAIKEG